MKKYFGLMMDVFMNYKMLLLGLATISCITIIIVLLSINHRQEANVHSQTTGSIPVAAASAFSIPSVPVPLDESQKISAVMGQCNIERVNDSLFDGIFSSNRLAPLVLTGWMIDTATKTVPREAGVRFQDTSAQKVWFMPIKLRIPRPDVVAIQGNNQQYLASGFSQAMDIGKLPEGEYHISLQFRSNGNLYVCDNGRVLRVTP